MRILLIFLTLLPFVSISQSIEAETAKGPNPWTSLEPNISESSFQFAIVTDRTGGSRPGIFEDAVRKLNLLQPEFVVSVGDLIEGYTEDRRTIAAEWNEFNGFISKLEMPFFYLPGNHDYTNDVMALEWKKRFGKDYYHFRYKDVLFLCLNSSGDLKKQYKYFKSTLEENADVKWTIALIHHPLFTYPSHLEWGRIEKLLIGRPHTVFAGHKHRYVKYEKNKSNYITLATTGGGSPLRGPQYGEFDHVVWVTMTDQGPVLANLQLSGIHNEDVSTEETRGLVDNLHFGEMLKVDPLYFGENGFDQGDTRLKITNSSDLPTSVSLNLENSASWIGEFKDKDIELGPNSTHMIELPVYSFRENEIREPMKLHARFEYLLSPGNLLKIDKQVNIKPARKHSIPAKEKIVVDGNLSEWDKSLFIEDGQRYINADPFSHSGPEDASFAFTTAVTDKALLIAVTVTDDDISTDKNTEPFNQDGIGILIDPRSSPISAYTTKYALFNQVMYIAMSPSKDDSGKPYLYNEDKLPEKTKVRFMRTNKGWDAEVSIPISYIKGKQGPDWDSVRLNLILSDSDKNGIHFTEIYWKPDWRRNQTYSGSGMFERISQ